MALPRKTTATHFVAWEAPQKRRTPTTKRKQARSAIQLGELRPVRGEVHGEGEASAAQPKNGRKLASGGGSAGVHVEELAEVERRTIDVGGTARKQGQETAGAFTGRRQERRPPGGARGCGIRPEQRWGRTGLAACEEPHNPALLPRSSSARQLQCRGPQGRSALHARLRGNLPLLI